MKKLVVLIAFFASAQAKSQITVGDGIGFTPGKDTTIGILIDPIITTRLSGNSDTALSMSWTASNISREGGQFDLLILVYNRRGQPIGSKAVVIPAMIAINWGSDNSIIDNYIFSVTRFKPKQ